MKYLIFLALLGAYSCGKYETLGTGTDRVGGIMPLTKASVNSTDRTNLLSVCDSLKVKSNMIGSALNSTHTFTTNQEDCDGTSLGGGNVKVVLQTGSSGFVFKKESDGLDFMFPQVETDTQGIMSSICSGLRNSPNFQLPIIGTDVTTVTTQAINPADCTPVTGEICVKVSKATPDETNSQTATVHTVEWFRVRISSPDGKYLGFLTQRKKITKSFCGNNEFLTYEASLKTK